MLLFVYLLLSFLKAEEQSLTISSETLILNSFYDIYYIKDVSSIFFTTYTVENTTGTINILFSLKNKNYTRSDIYVFLSCIYERKIDLEEAVSRISKGNLINFLKSYGCSYIELKNKAYDFIRKSSEFQKSIDLDLLTRIVDTYFKEDK